MRTSLKVTIGVVLVALVVGVLAFTAMGSDDPQGSGARDAATGGTVDGSSGADGTTGDGMAMCIEGVPDCDDMVVIPDGDDAVSAPVDDGAVGPAPEPQPIEPDPDAVDLRARPFDSATVGDDGRTITIDFTTGVSPCSVLGDIRVDEGPRAVTITLLEGHLETGEDVACIEIALYARTTVMLDEPLGDRKIVDGAA